MAEDTWTAPEMVMVAGGVAVQSPAAYLIAPTPGKAGISVGASHLPGVGATLHIGIHSEAGATLIASLNGEAFYRLAELLKEATSRIKAGEFANAPVTQ